MDHNISQLRKKLGCSKRWVVKIGSSLVTKNGLGLNNKLIHDWAKQISQLVCIICISSSRLGRSLV